MCFQHQLFYLCVGESITTELVHSLFLELVGNWAWIQVSWYPDLIVPNRLLVCSIPCQSILTLQLIYHIVL